jgi:hypothetical protein
LFVVHPLYTYTGNHSETDQHMSVPLISSKYSALD